MKIDRFVAALAIVVCISSPSWCREPQTWALLVGVNTYERPEISTLDYAEADARLLGATLSSLPGGDPSRIFTLTTDQKGESKPSAGNIILRLEYLITKKLEPQDTLIIFFSGHGLEIEGNTYLLTQDTDPRSLWNLQRTALKTSELFEFLKQAKARNLLVVIDACRNDPRKGGRGSEDNLLTNTQARDFVRIEVERSNQPSDEAADYNTAVLFACSPQQRSYESVDLGHGFFSYYLSEALKGAARDPKGQVTLQSTIDYVQSKVPDESEKTTMIRQKPWMRYSGSGAQNWTFNTVEPRGVTSSPNSVESTLTSLTALQARVEQVTQEKAQMNLALQQNEAQIRLLQQEIAQNDTNLKSLEQKLQESVPASTAGSNPNYMHAAAA